MIKFIPQEHREASGTIFGAKWNIANQANRNLAEVLNRELDQRECEVHPDFENEILVDSLDGSEPFKILKCCCDEFRKVMIHVMGDYAPPGS